MAGHEVWDFAVTIPAGTPIAAPLTTPTPMPARVVTAIHWRVPRGSLGLMGWRITSSTAQIIPRQPGGWMIHDGQSGTWELEDMPDSGAYEVTGYNTGTQPHTIYVTYMARKLNRPQPLPQLWARELFAEVPDLSHAGPPIAGR